MGLIRELRYYFCAKMYPQVFDAIAQECAHQQIYVHLDNHVSKAGWCCSGDDGNAWFGDKYFDTTKWERALGYMADHVSIENTREWNMPD